MKGFFQKKLIVDLDNRRYLSESIQEHVLQAYLGGKGLGIHLLMENNPQKVDPLAPESCMVVSLGPLADSPVYSSCRYGVFAKSPLTGLYGESYSGGRAAVPMSRTGYDAFVIRGASDTPVWIEISDDDVRFHDASDLWGRDTYATEDEVKARVGVKDCAVMAIGPAGENRVRFALIENDYWRSSGRTGMGAVLGSKKVKAIAFHGKQRRPFKDPEGLKSFAKDTIKNFKDHQVAQNYRKFGTSGGVAVMNNMNAFPARYWSAGSAEHWNQIDGDSLIARCKPKPMACKTCFVGCGQYVSVQNGRHRGLTLDGPEYETVSAFGGLCLVDQIEEIVYLNDLCDRLGLDTISAGNVAAFAIEAAKRGKIDESIEYGDADGIAALLKKIAKREGIGDVLAEGVRIAGAELNLEELAVHVKGLEPPGFEPRTLKGMGLAFAVSERGACHLRSPFYYADFFNLYDPDDVENTVKLFLEFENKATLQDCLIVCRMYREFYQVDDMSKIIAMATGLSLNKNGLDQLASRVKNATRLYNIQEGLTKADDQLPKRLLKESIKDAPQLNANLIQNWIQAYYDMRGWNQDGVPVEC